MIYLASPYSHPHEHLRIRRYLAARDFCHLEMHKGVIIFSPIVYGHQFAYDLLYKGDHETWASFNNDLLLSSSALWVLQLDGWQQSAGVAWELERAEKIGLPIEYKEPPLYAPL